MDIVKSKKKYTKTIKNNNKPIIVLMTRWHAIYRCKSRLSRDIGAFKAAKIQENLTNHTIAVAKEIQKEGLADIKIAIDGIGIKAAKRWGILNKIKTVELQGHGNLGTKMKRQFLKTHSKKTHSLQTGNPVLIIGTDSPSISRFDLTQAIQTLKHKEMVLGPSSDGGYWLIGLSSKLINPLCSWPFSGVSWGTDTVLKETIQKAFVNQIDFRLIQTKNDLDNIIDLSPWFDHKKFQLSVSSYQL
tara:strand:+ start:53 stop:784 length:732 start_codon:yes stop_codon:yes gene_type:complete